MNGLLPVNVQRRAGSAGMPALVLGPGTGSAGRCRDSRLGPGDAAAHGRRRSLRRPSAPRACGLTREPSLRPPHLGRGCRKASSALLTLLEPKAGGNGVCGIRLALFWLLGGAVEDFWCVLSNR